MNPLTPFAVVPLEIQPGAPWYSITAEAASVFAEIGPGRVVPLVDRANSVQRRVDPVLKKVTNRLYPRFPVVERVGRFALADEARECQSLVVMASGVSDLHVATQIADLHRTKAERKVLVVFEVWRTQIDQYAPLLARVADGFDLVMIGVPSTVPDLARAIGRPVLAMPGAIDVLACDKILERLGGRRSIDVLNFGRRNPVQHDVLRRRQRDESLAYSFDTLSGGRASDLAEHRQEFLTQVCSSRYLVCNDPKFDQPWVTNSQRDYGMRIYEAMGPGALPIGVFDPLAMERDEFRFAGIRLEGYGADEFEAALETAPGGEDFEHASLVNRSLAARHHDWSHRFKLLLDGLSLQPSPDYDCRAHRLADVADRLKRSVTA